MQLQQQAQAQGFRLNADSIIRATDQINGDETEAGLIRFVASTLSDLREITDRRAQFVEMHRIPFDSKHKFSLHIN